MQNAEQTPLRLLGNRWIWGYRLTRSVGIGYAFSLAGLVLLSRFFGERCWPLSPFLYLPAQTWLLPLAVLLPAALFFDRRLLALLAFCVWLVVFCFGGLRLGLGTRAPAPGTPCLTVLTNNIGQANHQSIIPFVNEQNPDLIVLQEAHGFACNRVFPGRFSTGVGEFIMISRFPITQVQALTGPRWRNAPAAMFKVDWPGHPITVFAVHIPTPRPDFLRLRGHGFLAELLLGKTRGRFEAYAGAIRQRVEVARWLEARIAEESGPVLAVGDFNMPSWGCLHARFTSRLTDSFEAAGRGFGFTFPGFTRNPVSFFGPWLRIDYLFANREWTPLTCQTEPHRPSQHRCVAARFALSGT